MWHRIKQFLHALTAAMTEDDYLLTAEYLNAVEQQAFSAMDINSQKHCVLVARTCLKLYQSYSPEALGPAGSPPALQQPNLNRLLKAALLHDIGKVKGDLSTFDRVIVVMVSKVAPDLGLALSARYSKANPSDLGHAFHVYYNHPKLGALMAESLGLEREICQLIANHHRPPYSGEAPELTILRQADNLH